MQALTYLEPLRGASALAVPPWFQQTILTNPDNRIWRCWHFPGGRGGCPKYTQSWIWAFAVKLKIKNEKIKKKCTNVKEKNMSLVLHSLGVIELISPCALWQRLDEFLFFWHWYNPLTSDWFISVIEYHFYFTFENHEVGCKTNTWKMLWGVQDVRHNRNN